MAVVFKYIIKLGKIPDDCKG